MQIMGKRLIVLIDTWWNVNLIRSILYLTVSVCFNRYMVECELNTLTSTLYPVPGFNRYMVECEYFIHDEDCNIFTVLIDTWWNVNIKSNDHIAGGKAVLIDTWWNVNEFLALVYMYRRMPF